MRNVVSFVLGGGRGTRLHPLTKYRSKPAVPLAGKYRLIDIPLSNCLNSKINRLYVLTQFMSVSLHRHIRQTYRFDNFCGGFVELLAAQQTADKGTDWYQGTADAVRKNVRYLEQPGVDYVLILSGDQLYRMDYREMIQTHEAHGADVTIAAIPVVQEEACNLGIMKINDTGKVVGFVEKPQTPDLLDDIRMDAAWLDARGFQSRGRQFLASMGIYLFKRDLLVKIMNETDYQDFGKEVFPGLIDTHNVQVHVFDDYWEDIGTIRAFYEANLSLTKAEPPFRLACPENPVYTRARFLPPTRIAGGSIRDSLIADGCEIQEGAVIENSLIGLRCIIHRNVTIRNSIIMGADYYEGPLELDEDKQHDRPPIEIGEGSVIDGAIVDKNCHIGKNVRVLNSSGISESDPDDDICVIRDGIPVVLKNASLPDGWTM